MLGSAHLVLACLSGTLFVIYALHGYRRAFLVACALLMVQAIMCGVEVIDQYLTPKEDGSTTILSSEHIHIDTKPLRINININNE